MAMEESLHLPPGFRFHPTDEEIITHYLSPKVLSHGDFTARAIGDVDLKKCEPWDLPSKAKMGEKEWYFFCQRDRKYPTGMRTNRATESGYWKATGKDKEIYRERGILIGMKKTLVFYRGRAPNGVKTDWVMHEFRLEGKSSFSNIPKSSKDEWVVSRVFHKNTVSKKTPMLGDVDRFVPMNTINDELMDPHTSGLPPLMETSSFSSYPVNVDSSAPLNGFYYSDLHDSLPYCSNSCKPPPGSSYLQQIKTQNNPYWPAPMRDQYCKVEQFSSQSILSQDTAGDRNTDISSVISSASYGCAGGGVMDLANMWNC